MYLFSPPLENEPEHVVRVWKDLLSMISAGKLMPAVYDHIYEGLESIPQVNLSVERGGRHS